MTDLRYMYRAALIALALAMAATSARAHDIWMTSQGQGADIRLNIVYGHPPDDLSRAEPAKLFDLQLFGAKNASPILDKIEKDGGGQALTSSALGPQAPGAVVAARYDNGFWARKVDSYSNTNRLNIPETGRAIWSQKLSKLLLPGGDGTVHTRPVGHKVEIVPLQSPWSIDGNMQVQVLVNGKPFAKETRITIGDGATADDTSVVTDGKGVATVPVSKGRWYILSVSYSEKSRIPALADNDAYVATLSFRF